MGDYLLSRYFKAHWSVLVTNANKEREWLEVTEESQDIMGTLKKKIEIKAQFSLYSVFIMSRFYTF